MTLALMSFGRARVVAVLGSVAILAAAAGSSAVRAGADVQCGLFTTPRKTATSAGCLSCHDGTVAAGVQTAPAIGSTHPFEISYAAAQGRSRSLKPLSALPPQVVLSDGKITCVTCHDGASREPARTALPMRKSALCFACHDF